MKELMNIIDQARTRSATLNDLLAAKHNIRTNDFPINGLNMANQGCVLALESLFNYNNIWSKPLATSKVSLEQLREENAQRIVALTKSSFILNLSSFEFCAKQSISLYPNKVNPIKGRIYLRKIVKASVQAGIIPATDELPWEGIIELRNTLVHNNGYAEKTKYYNIPDTQGISFVSGQMTRGSLKFFSQMQMWAIEAFARWCDGLLT